MTTSENKLTRRSFLATTGLVAGAMATAGMAGLQSVSPAMADEATEDAPVSEEESYISTCRGNCGGRCALKAVVREGKIVSTMPIEFEREAEGTQVGCMKGVTNPLRIYGPARLQYPMKRVGERGSGEWERISWDEALDTIAEKITAAIEEYGPASVGFQFGAGNMNGMVNTGAAGIMGGPIASYGRGYGISRLCQGLGSTVFSVGHDMAGIIFNFVYLTTPSNPLEDLANAKTIISWGSNPAEASFCKSAWHWICRGRENGAKLITIDPLYTSTAAHSDEWVPVRTGTDAALMAGMIHYIVDNDLVDWDYVANHSVAPFLIDADGKYARLSTLGQAEAGTDEDVPVVWDEDAQAFVAHTEAINPAVHGEYDVEGVAVRTVFDAAMENIAQFTVEFAAKECDIPAEQIENLARTCATEGPTSYYVNYGLEHTYESWRVYFLLGLLVSLTGSVGKLGASYRGSISCDQATAAVYHKPPVMNTDELVVPDAKPVMSITGDWLVEIMETGQWLGQDYPIRVLYTATSNTLDNFSGPTDMIKAYEKIDFIVTADNIMTTTCHYSDMVLPVAMPWESVDFSNNGIYCQKAIEPIGEAKADFDICVELAAKLGLSDLYTKDAEGYLQTMLDTPENIEAGFGFDEMSKKGVILGDYTVATDPVPEYNKFGRTQFYMEYMPSRDGRVAMFDLQDRLPYYKPSIEAYAENPDREKYPLYGMSNHDHYHGQTLWAHNQWLDDYRTLDGKPFCRIHPEAAEARGIETSDKVRVFNDHGFVVLNALVTPGIRPDTVWVPHGFTWDEFEDGFAQSLTRWCPDEVTSNNNLNDWICEVEKL